jgi:hypothetical protein
MTELEVPLYRESAAFVRRLEDAVRAYGESKHRWSRRTNWSYRYAADFHLKEAHLFSQDPDRYLSGLEGPRPTVEDVFLLPVSGSTLIKTLMKVAAHWLFSLLGALLCFRRDHHAEAHIYRKCYVDDIETAFDPDENGVHRFVFPFPLNRGRQWRYIQSLRKRSVPFTLAGYPYGIRDLICFLIKRDTRSLERLESRAQIRLGRTVRRQANWQTIQLSDEFDICSLDFVGALRRPGIRVVNSAHGVGKYVPIHAYDEFRVLTRKQEGYYHALRPCLYVLGYLFPSQLTLVTTSGQQPAISKPQFVFVSQTSRYSGIYFDRCEGEVLACLATEFAGSNDIELLIKPHPSRSTPLYAPGFKILESLASLGPPEATVFASFFSTSHVDPAFRGTKLLLSYDLIRPEILFDNADSIVTLDELIEIIRRMKR